MPRKGALWFGSGTITKWQRDSKQLRSWFLQGRFGLDVRRRPTVPTKDASHDEGAHQVHMQKRKHSSKHSQHAPNKRRTTPQFPASTTERRKRTNGPDSPSVLWDLQFDVWPSDARTNPRQLRIARRRGREPSHVTPHHMPLSLSHLLELYEVLAAA